MVKTSYNFKTGLWKSLKNLAIVVGIPALVLFADNWTQIFPNEWNLWLTPVMGFISYLVKNYISNK